MKLDYFRVLHKYENLCTFNKCVPMFIFKKRVQETANKKAKLSMSSISLGAFNNVVDRKRGWGILAKTEIIYPKNVRA